MDQCPIKIGVGQAQLERAVIARPAPRGESAKLETAVIQLDWAVIARARHLIGQ
jgi:hypothetical protein